LSHGPEETTVNDYGKFQGARRPRSASRPSNAMFWLPDFHLKLTCTRCHNRICRSGWSRLSPSSKPASLSARRSSRALQLARSSAHRQNTRKPPRHRLNALAIARADKPRHVERAHPATCLVPQSIQKRLEPNFKLVLPIQRPANHGRPLQKPTTHESQKK